MIVRLRSRIGREDHGFSLIELLIVMALLGLVIALVASALWTVQRSETYSRGRTKALDEMRLTLNRVSKDLRQAETVVGTPTASRVEVRTYIGGSLENVVYEAVGDRLMRTIYGNPVELMYEDLVSTDVFTYKPDEFSPELITVTLVVRPSNLPDTTLTLDTKVDLRNQ